MEWELEKPKAAAGFLDGEIVFAWWMGLLGGNMHDARVYLEE